MAKKAAPKSAKNKRKVSGKRGSAGRRKKQSGVDPRGVAGIAVLCVGLLAFISQFIPSGGGLLNSATMLTRGLGGTLCLLLPVVLCWAGVTLVFFSSGRMSARTMICGALVFLFVETLLQLFEIGTVTSAIFADGQQATYGTFLLRSYKSAMLTCKGGGLIGALLAWPLYKALDVWGAVIVLIFACTIVLMVLTGVSLNGVGMYLSELLDDLRASRSEQREEREALRERREEEALRRETELAEQREAKRIERERQEAAERERLEAEAYGGQAAAQEDKPVRKRKARPAPEAAQAPEQDVPPIQTEPPAQRTARQAAPQARKRTAIREDMPLYIERDDEFARESIETRAEPRGPRRRHSFTIEEAENAFLYGMDSTPPAQEPVYPAQTPEYDAQTLAQEEPAYAQEPWAQAAQPAAEPEEPLQQETYPEQDEPEDDVPFWKANPDMVIEHYEAQQDDEVIVRDADEPETPPPVRRAPVAEPAANVTGTGTGAGSTPLSRSIAAAQAAANRDVPRVQNVLAAQEAAAKDDTIVQLRGTRPDGTPLVLPKKDAHEAPKVEGPEYVYPPIDLLNRTNSTQDPNMSMKIQQGAGKLLSTLESFGVQAKLTHVTHGPAITRYELQPAPGVKVSRIVNLVDDIALNMASDGVRIEAPIPGKPAVGIEIPNEKIETVSLRDVLESPEMTREKSPTAVALGKGISGAPVIADMAKMPHVLIAGATGSGKSVCINTIINSIIYRASPREVRLILIDPKVVELSVYNGIPHLLVPVVTDPKKASAALSWAVVEMEHRYKRFETMGVRNIKGYNEAIGPDEEPMSKIIVIIDELADLMMVAPGEVEESICRLAQLARAAGIHLVIATQRPSVNVITGVIKANIPSRIAFAVSSQIDSRTILDTGGAEKLLGKGDMLYAPQGAGKPTRVQGCFVSDDEVQRIVDFVRGKHTAEYSEDVMEQMNAAADEEKAAGGDTPASGEPVDEMLSKAIELAIEAGQVSISMLQRRLRVGYARAGRLVDEMTLRGITAEAEGPTKPRTVLISREEWRRMQENQE
ncbi:MAG: DNA translocase FtsK [Candidatus Ventricola sp.]